MQTALVEQLIDCTYDINENNPGHEILRILFGLPELPTSRGTGTIVRTVCINGRVGRILSTFTLLDADSILSSPEMDDKELFNEAYVKANKVLEIALDTHDNPVIRDLYSKPEDTLNMQEQLIVNRFRERAKSEIAKTLKADYENLIDEKSLYTIINNSVSVI